jgi:hypothetical protein
MGLFSVIFFEQLLPSKKERIILTSSSIFAWILAKRKFHFYDGNIYKPRIILAFVAITFTKKGSTT